MVSPSSRRSPANPFGTDPSRRSGTDSRSRRIIHAAQSRDSGRIASSLPNSERSLASYAAVRRWPVTERIHSSRSGRTNRSSERWTSSTNRFSWMKSWAGRKSVCDWHAGDALRGRVPACVATPMRIPGRTMTFMPGDPERLSASLPWASTLATRSRWTVLMTTDDCRWITAGLPRASPLTTGSRRTMSMMTAGSRRIATGLPRTSPLTTGSRRTERLP